MLGLLFTTSNVTEMFDSSVLVSPYQNVNAAYAVGSGFGSFFPGLENVSHVGQIR